MLAATAAVLFGAVRVALWCLGAGREEDDRFTQVLLLNGILFAGIVGTFSALLCGYLASAYGLTILHDTAHGADDVESWPRALLLEDCGAMGYLASGLLLAALPGLLPAGVWHWLGVSRPWAIAVGFPALLPLFLLSMLERQSPLSPFSPRVWRSLLYAWRAWTLFYLLSFAALGLSAWLFDLLGRHGGWTVGIVGWGLLAAVVWMAYFRLLGRLAWFCSGRWANTV